MCMYYKIVQPYIDLNNFMQIAVLLGKNSRFFIGRFLFVHASLNISRCVSKSMISKLWMQATKVQMLPRSCVGTTTLGLWLEERTVSC